MPFVTITRQGQQPYNIFYEVAGNGKQKLIFVSGTHPGILNALKRT
jgi:hypothetical protein